MAVPPIVIKAIATAATDKRTWEFIAMLIAAVLMPVILCVMSVAILVTGAESSSVSLLEYSFNSEELPSGVSEEQRQAADNIRLWLVELDEEITEYPDSDSLDENLVKAVFYGANIGGEAVVTQPYADFLSCFEDRTAEDLREVLEDISEQFTEITITDNQLSGIRKVYDFLNEMEVSDEEN